MLYKYLIDNFNKSEPIFLCEIEGYSKYYVRQEMKKLTDEGKIKRLYNGVYYIPYISVLGTEGKVSVKKYIEKRFLYNSNAMCGYYTGLSLMNILGFTTQNPACYEICSNSASTKQRKINVDGFNMIIYKPIAEITNENYKELQFLDLMMDIDKYCELNQKEMKLKLKEYTNEYKIDFEIVKRYLPLYPDKVFKNIYFGGLMNELV